jgi:hypothetical protein
VSLGVRRKRKMILREIQNLLGSVVLIGMDEGSEVREI